MKSNSILFVAVLGLSLVGCKTETKEKEHLTLWSAYDETEEIVQQQEHESDRMKFKLIQSKVTDKNIMFQPLANAVMNFSQERYDQMTSMVLEQDIPTIQKHIAAKDFNYEELTLFFLKRIYNFELDSAKTLNAIIALNPNILEEARAKDRVRDKDAHPIFGMPILLKDNISTKDMPTTAGAVVLKDNQTVRDAALVKNLRSNGALILGKLNLSEWAYYFCQGCPLGYSAIGGQTLNPYGRKRFETGGSSAGSGVAAAANYAIATVGTETAGSIISPTSQNSLVGLKPTVGVIPGAGVVPISHTLDTAGPMTKNVTDNAILLDAMTNGSYSDVLRTSPKLESYRFGAYKRLLSDSIYNATVKFMKEQGVTIVELQEPEIPLDGFLTLLNLDMKQDLPKYLESYASKEVSEKNLEDIMVFNQQDSIVNMPYDQGLFDGIMADSTSAEEFSKLKTALLENGNKFFQQDIEGKNLDAILSINNYHSAYAAVGLHPCLAVPMGYKESGEPIALTFISSPETEAALLKMGLAFEKVRPIRKIPKDYNN